MLFKKFRPLEVPGRYEFKDPDTGYVYREKRLPDLYRAIITYRAQNELPMLDELPVVVENYLCDLPENRGKCEARELKRSWASYIRGGMALIKNLAFRRFVDVSVAEKRGAQCVACKYNYFPDKGPFISFVDDLAVKQVGERRVSMHEKLGTCAACTCPLRGKVFVTGPLEKFTDAQVKKMAEVKCWQLELSGQDGKFGRHK